MRDPELAAIRARPDVRRFERWVIFINWLIALAGVGVVVYVYFHYSLPPVIQRPGLNRYGEPFRPETIREYLSVFLVFQIWVAAMPLLGRWVEGSSVGAEMQEGLQRIFPRIKPAPTTPELIKTVLAALVVAEVVLFIATIYRVNFAFTASL